MRYFVNIHIFVSIKSRVPASEAEQLYLSTSTIMITGFS